MGTITPAALPDVALVLPDILIEQYVKPAADQAALLNAFRLTAIGWVEQHTGHAMQRRLWTATYDRFAPVVRLPRTPVRSVTSVFYGSIAGIIADAAGLYQLSGEALSPKAGTCWPQTTVVPGTIKVDFEAGYDDVATEAPALQVAALMLTKHLFDGGSLDDVPATVTLLLDAQYRTPVIA